MPHSLPFFYGSLRKVKTVENVITGETMKDFLRATRNFLQMVVVAIAVLALFIGIRFALFVPLHNETIGVKDPAPIAASDGGCAVRQVKMPCFRNANPEGGAMTSVPLQSVSAGAETIASQDMRCAVQQVKFPCLQPTDPRS